MPRTVPSLRNLEVIALLASLSGHALATPAVGAPVYSGTILGTLRSDGTGTSFAGGINDAGVVVGGASSAAAIVVFRWRAGTGMSDRGTLVSPFPSYGFAINSSETLCGYGVTQSTGFAQPLREEMAETLFGLPRLGGGADGYAYRIAENGMSVGWSNSLAGCGSPTCVSNPGRAVAWDAAGNLSPLPDLGGYFSAATDISPDGTKICGYAATPSNLQRAFRLVSGVATELPPLAGYSGSQAWGINDAGQVVGVSGQGDNRRATLWDNTTPIDLGLTPGASGSFAYQINAAGTIVGYVVHPGAANRAVTFSPGSPPTDLNASLQTPLSYTLLHCTDVNASGQIVGQADSAGTARGFVLTPVGTAGVETGSIASGLLLRTMIPNPVRSSTTLRFSLSEPGRVRLDIVDLGGRVVAELATGWRSAGEHAVEWDGRGTSGEATSPGVYFARLAGSGRIVTRKLVIRR